MHNAAAMDVMNAIFEFGGSLAVLPSIIEAQRTKRIMGVSIITSLFFASWGIWNVFYYPSLDQMWSAAAAVALATANTIWLCQVWIYRQPFTADDSAVDDAIAEQILESERATSLCTCGGNE